MINIDDNNVDQTSEDISTEIQDQSETTDSSVQEPTTVDNSTTEQQDASFFDPNQVPEELKPAYKQMQAAFTKKTQEIAEARKATEALRVDAETFNKYKQYVPVLDEMIQARSANQETPEMQAMTQKLKSQGYSDDAIEMMKLGAQFTLDQVNRYKQEQEVNQQTAFVESKISEAGQIDPRLNDPSLVYQTDDGENITFGQMVEELVASDPNWVNDPVQATQRGIKKVDALIGRAKTEGKKELSVQAKSQAAKFPQTNSSSQGATQNNKPLSFQEAYQEAKAEVGH